MTGQKTGHFKLFIYLHKAAGMPDERKFREIILIPEKMTRSGILLTDCCHYPHLSLLYNNKQKNKS